jgi:type IVB pilus formation R64 PilN family outer membrane protein
VFILNKAKTIIAGVLACFLVSGCISPKDFMHPPGEEGIASGEKDIAKLQVRKDKDFAHRDAVIEKDGLYISGDVLPFLKGSQIPDHFDKEIVVIEPPMFLSQIAQRLTEIAGVPVNVGPRLYEYIEQQEEDQEGSEIVDPAMQASASPSQENKMKLALNFEGRLSRLLDIIAAHYGITWQFDAGVIEMYRVKTKTFTLAALPGNVKVNDTISNKTEEDGESSGGAEATSSTSQSSGQSTKVEQNFTVWEEIIGNVRSMLSNQGSAVGNPTAGTISVTDTPSILEQVNDYIEQINKKLAKQVSIAVKVYSFESEDFLNAGANLDPVFQDLENTVRVTVSSARPMSLDPGTGNLLATILDTTSESHPGWGSQWEESSLLLQALKRHGKVSLVTSGSGITLNNQPLPIQNISRIGYLKSVSVTSTSDVGTETELEAGEVSTGFSMLAVPHILENNRVALQYSISLSSLDNLNTIESGDQMIQTPEVSTRAFMQRVGMKLGSTLVLAGFEQARDEDEAGRGLFGYMKDGTKKRRAIIVVITVNDVAGA